MSRPEETLRLIKIIELPFLMLNSFNGLHTITERELSKPVSPNPADVNIFMRAQFSEAQRLPDFSGVRNFVPHGEGGTAGVLFQLLENDKAIMGVNLYGCTSVLVMSRRGVWVSANITSCIRARH
jgi:hypothetical protein